ncbi:ipis-1-like [Haemaphysalis longicornis]
MLVGHRRLEQNTGRVAVFCAASRQQQGSAGGSPLKDGVHTLSQDNVASEVTGDMEAVISRGLLHLGVDLLRELRRSSTEDGNLIVSPYAVASCLEELLVAATGSTADQIAAMLHIPPGQRVTKYFQDRDREIPTRRLSDARRRFDMGYLNNIHSDQGLPTAYTSSDTEERLRLEHFSWDFAGEAEQSRADIDRYLRLYASSFEPGEILPRGSITPASQVLLVSVVDFRGSWMHEFDNCTPTSKPFYESAQEAPTVVLMLSQTGRFRTTTCDDLGATALEVPYWSPAISTENVSRVSSLHFGATRSSASADWGPKFSLVILLPNEVDGLAALMDKLTAFTLQRCLSQLKAKGVIRVNMPLFRLKHTAQTGGRRLSENKPRQQRQSAAAEVIAPLARAISSMVRRPQPPLDFTVDRPFAFAVVCMHPDTFLLLGCVRKIIW